MDESSEKWRWVGDVMPEVDMERLKYSFQVAQEAFASNDTEKLVALLSSGNSERARIAAGRARHSCS